MIGAFVLTVYMISPDGSAIETRVGTIVSEDVCNVAGQGIASVLIDEDPALVVAWSCTPAAVGVS